MKRGEISISKFSQYLYRICILQCGTSSEEVKIVQKLFHACLHVSDREKKRERYLQVAFNFIIGQTINLHQLPDLFWGGHCFHDPKYQSKTLNNSSNDKGADIEDDNDRFMIMTTIEVIKNLKFSLKIINDLIH